MFLRCAGIVLDRLAQKGIIAHGMIILSCQREQYFFYKNLAYGGERKDIAIIVDCPLFLRETKELRKASRRKMLEKLDYEYVCGNRGLSNYKVSL